jgi:peptidoglycan-associated lipoprotein
MKQIAKLALLALLAMAFVACGGKQVKEEEGADTQVVTQPAQEETGQAEPLPSEAEVTETQVEETDLISERKIYFDFDKSDIKDEFRAIVEAHAKYLVDNPAATVSIEGHCDERGTREYNMALGERRAFSVLQMLTLLGVSKSQVKTVSFGEERPDVDGHDESAWKWNRRAVFVYSE